MTAVDPEPNELLYTMRHFGLVVDDLSAVKRRLDKLDVECISTTGLDFYDLWGNRIQIVAYEEIQFTKPNHVLSAMDLSSLEEFESAITDFKKRLAAK